NGNEDIIQKLSIIPQDHIGKKKLSFDLKVLKDRVGILDNAYDENKIFAQQLELCKEEFNRQLNHALQKLEAPSDNPEAMRCYAKDISDLKSKLNGYK
ncbi:hypothetical protein A2U01_0018856, partial [Trifolium medium]|nr:hypothetical protein [Trifolium medium]